jgi:hypothetical protein
MKKLICLLHLFLSFVLMSCDSTIADFVATTTVITTTPLTTTATTTTIQEVLDKNDYSVYQDKKSVVLQVTMDKTQMLGRLALGTMYAKVQSIAIDFTSINEDNTSRVKILFQIKDDQYLMYELRETGVDFEETYHVNNQGILKVSDFGQQVRYYSDSIIEDSALWIDELLEFNNTLFMEEFYPTFHLYQEDFAYAFEAGTDAYGHFVMTIDLDEFYLRVVLDSQNRIVYYEKITNTETYKLMIHYDIEIELILPENIASRIGLVD